MPVLLIDEGSSRGAEFAVERVRVRIGRGDKVDLRIFDDDVSRVHCELVLEGTGAYVLKDLGSQNGTYCNGVLVHEGIALKAGDRIVVGRTTLRFLLEPAASRDTAPSGGEPGAIPGGRAVDAANGDSGYAATRSPLGPAPQPVLAPTPLLGQGPAMRLVREQIRRVAPTPTPLLIVGESGTGKELCALAVHAASPRAKNEFVTVNCGAVPEDVLADELFGHVRGAFTGAESERRGHFETANGGTIFLDEVGDCSPKLQKSLLRVLESRTFSRLGDSATRTSDARVIAATHRDLERMIQQDLFREDLYYRLNVVTIRMPPLRERLEDLEALVDGLLERLACTHGRRCEISKEALAAIREFRCPNNNIRELRNLLESAMVLSAARRIELDHLPASLRAADASVEAKVDAMNLETMLQAAERRHISWVLEELKWNKSEAAKRLGIARNTLDRRIDSLKIQRPPSNP